MIYNSSSYDSLSQAVKFGEDFQKFYLTQISQSHEDIYQLKLKDENNNIEDSVQSISNMVMPIIFVMLAFQGTSSFANDIFAGEKERRTLELLLQSGVKRSYIYYGKSLTLLILAIINLLFSFASFGISSLFSGAGLQQFKITVNGNAALNILCMILPLFLLSVISVLISLSVSMVSKGIKDAQIINELLLVIPVGISALLSFGVIKAKAVAYHFIPIVNLMIDFIRAFNGQTNVSHIVLSLITNGILVVILLFISVKYIKTEKITA